MFVGTHPGSAAAALCQPPVSFLLCRKIVLVETRNAGNPDIDPLGHERRFLPSNEQVEAFIQALVDGTPPEANKSREPAATTWTTYFDTQDLRYFRSCDGPVARRLRVREYDGGDRGRAS